MSKLSRAERREAAQARRTEWSTRWKDIWIAQLKLGIPMRQVLAIIANDADGLIRKTPQLKSEILAALNEYADSVKFAIAKAQTKILVAEAPRTGSILPLFKQPEVLVGKPS
jgi:hypothetical protein